MSLKEEEDEDGFWEDCDNEEEMVIHTTCLFCLREFKSPSETFGHCAHEHRFNICEFQRKHQLEFFDYIKMINYCRSKGVSAEELQCTAPSAWQSDDYMKPVIPDDGLLQFDVEDVDTLGLQTSNSTQNNDVTRVSGDAAMNGDVSTHSDDERSVLLARCRAAEERAGRAEAALQHAMQDMDTMRQMAGNLLSSASDVTGSHEAIKQLKDAEDDAYISGYSHFSIHEEMLKDRVRTEYYRDCMYENRELFKDKVVLDVGCGTGILSMFAARAGAKLVIGVDMSDIIYQAMDIVRENGLEDKVTLMKGRMEDLELPVEKVDIIISEWMGYFLLFESMLDTVLWARDRYLVEGGLILPDYCDLYIAGISDPGMVDSHITYWEDVYGFKMNCMKACVVREASVGVVKPETIATQPARIKEVDLCTCSTRDLEFSSAFQLTASRDTRLTALVGYFDIKWVLQDRACCFSTSPSEQTTHWKQTIFLLENPVAVNKGDVLEGSLICKKNRKDPRSLDVTVTLNGKTQAYILT